MLSTLHLSKTELVPKMNDWTALIFKIHIACIFLTFQLLKIMISPVAHDFSNYWQITTLFLNTEHKKLLVQNSTIK